MAQYTPEQVQQQIDSMDKFAHNGWAHGCADGTMSPRGVIIQDMLKELKRLSAQEATVGHPFP